MSKWITSEFSTRAPAGSDLAQVLKTRFGASEVFITGRGASAIYAACRAISHPGAWIALPSHICPSVPLAIIRSGMRPWFLDIRKEDLNLDPEEIKTLPSGTAGLIAPHMYGNPLEMNKISAYCRERGIILIEDIAQSAGVTLDGKYLGTFGDLAVMSFHPSKLLPGNGGGALIVNNPILSLRGNIKREVNLLPHAPHDSAARSVRISYEVNKLLNDTREGVSCENQIASLYLANIDLIPQMQNPGDEKANLDSLNGLDIRLQLRRERSFKYSKAITDKLVLHPLALSGLPVFRYSILIDGNEGPVLRKKITDKLRQNNIHASNLYYPANQIFSDYSNGMMPVAEWVGRRIINLWLDDNASDEYISNTAEIIHHTVKNF